MKYIVDLDNTLVFTDELNNAAYNYALAEVGLDPLSVEGRLTRLQVFYTYSDLSDEVRSKIVAAKQSYFLQHLEQSVLNQNLLKHLCGSKNDFVVWTGADSERASHLLLFHGINKNVKDIFYFSKDDPVGKVCEIVNVMNWHIEDVCVIDDDSNVIQMLKNGGIKAEHCERKT